MASGVAAVGKAKCELAAASAAEFEDADAGGDAEAGMSCVGDRVEEWALTRSERANCRIGFLCARVRAVSGSPVAAAA